MTIDGNHAKLEELFKKSNVKLGDLVMVETDNATNVGILIPRYENADANHLVLKLKSGYNIGINLGKIKSIKKISEKLDPVYKHDVYAKYKDYFSHDNNDNDFPQMKLPHLSLLSTGGTISSKIDYRTGGDRKSTRLNSSHRSLSRMPSSA